jgi:hypothetical protein
MNNFTSNPGQNGSSADVKAGIMDEVRREAAMANARQLVQVDPASS